VSIQSHKKISEIHDYDARIAAMKKHIQQELSENNSGLILSYDREMVKESLAKATRRKHLEVILIQTKILEKDCKHAS